MVVCVIGKQRIKGKEGKKDFTILHCVLCNNSVDGHAVDRIFLSDQMMDYKDVEVCKHYNFDYDSKGYLLSVSRADDQDIDLPF